MFTICLTLAAALLVALFLLFVLTDAYSELVEEVRHERAERAATRRTLDEVAPRRSLRLIAGPVRSGQPHGEDVARG